MKETVDNTTDRILLLATSATVLPSNLLVNPGAEAGSVDGWNPRGASNVIVDSGGILNDGYNPRTGRFCFAGGYGPGTPAELVQNVKLLGGVQGFTEQQLDSGRLQAYFSFYLQTYDIFLMRNDLVEVIVTFLSASSGILGRVSSAPLACKAANPGWCPFDRIFRLPFGTRSIDYTMRFIRNDVVGSAIDCYIDDNSLLII